MNLCATGNGVLAIQMAKATNERNEIPWGGRFLTFTAWIDWAQANEHTHLNYFNITSEIEQHHASTGITPGALFDRANLPAGIAAFADYLDTITGALDRALGDFSGTTCSPANCAGAPLTSPRALAGVKAYGSLAPDERTALSLSSAKCTDAETNVATIIAAELSSSPTAHNFPDTTKQAIGDVVSAKFSPSRASTRPAAASAGTPAGGVTIPPTTVAQELMWITCKAEFDVDCPSPTDPTDHLQSSAYAAMINRGLGLYGSHVPSSDIKGDVASYRIGPPMPSAIATHSQTLFRIAIRFEASFTSADLRDVRQPNLFSRGFDNLFVSRRPTSSSDMPGRTVRLLDKNCSCYPSDVDVCPTCAMASLPEAVTPREHLFRQGTLSMLGAHAVYQSDLDRYIPPQPHTIRAKNPF